MDRVKTGRQSEGDRTTAVRRDGFSPLLQRKVKENTATLCAKGTKGKTGYTRLSRNPSCSDFLPPSLPCAFSSVSCPHIQYLYHILYVTLPLFLSMAVPPFSTCVGE